MQRSATMGRVLESNPDPIVFTSSPDPFEDVARRRRERMRREKKERMGSEEDDDVFELDGSFGKGKEKEMAREEKRSGAGYHISDDSSDMELPDLDEVVFKKSTSKSTMSVVEEYYASRERDKKARESSQKDKEKQDKKASKEAEKEQKRLAREEKANEKERLAELARVNVVRTSKQRSSHEMMIDLPSTLEGSPLGEQVVKLLDKAEIRHSNWESSQPVVKWRREVTSQYDEENGQWEPVARRIEREDHILFIMPAKEFVELAVGEEGQDIDSHILGLKDRFPNSKIIYLIEGLALWMKKNKTIQNRNYTATVRNIGREEPAPNQRPRKKQDEYVDEDLVEDALLRAQVMHGSLIHHTAVMIETAEWILVFTQHISTIPYRSVHMFPSIKLERKLSNNLILSLDSANRP